MKWAIILFLLGSLSLPFETNAQLHAANANTLAAAQDSLQQLSYKMINAPTAEQRQKACGQFIPLFVNALKTPHSYAFPFDSLKQISILYDKERTFRIFTWAIALSEIQYRFYGALQIKTADGSLKLYPFFDNTPYIQNLDTITSPKAWIGALYYGMRKTTYNGKDIYTLMGWCGFSLQTNKKVLDVLTFQNGEPVFGAPLFSFPDDSVQHELQNRFFLEYKRDGNASMNYDSTTQMIVYDHLMSLNSQPDNKASLVPDGTYEAFKWINGKWVHLPRVFDETIEKPPVPKPLLETQPIEGNKNQVTPIKTRKD